MPSLFDPITLGAIEAPNRILMAPLTRLRATDAHAPTPLMADYYRQRASAGLIISEAVGISRRALGQAHAPGIWTAEQKEAWKPITEAVHEAGGRIIMQLWHQGRLARSATTGMVPLSASATRAPYHRPDRNPYSEAEAASLDDIRAAIDDYGAAARAAMDAGFDGVQVHGANGYLIDQFLRDNTNLREDEYGGTPENRIRFMREVVERVIAEVGAARTSIRLSPNGETQGADDSNPAAVFVPAAAALDKLGIGFLELREVGPTGTFGTTDVPKLSPQIRQVFSGPLVLNQEYTPEAGQRDLDSGVADAVAWGRLWISNPDLVERFRAGAEVTPYNPSTFYTPGPVGYTDYPRLEEAAAAA